VKIIRNRKKNLFLVIGLSFSFSFLFHIDERYFSYFPLIVFLIMMFGYSDVINRVKRGAIFSLFICLLMLPWLIRNYLVHNEIVILSTRTMNITNGIFNYDDDIVKFDHTGSRELSVLQIDSVLTGLKTHFSAGDRIPKDQIEEMRKGKFPHSYSSIENYFNRFIDLWRPVKLSSNYYMGGFSYMGPWSLKHNLATSLTYGILLPFLFIGLYRLIKQNKLIFIVFSSVLVYHSIIHMLFIPYTRDRYRIPVESIVIILGIYGMISFYKYIYTKLKVKLYS